MQKVVGLNPGAIYWMDIFSHKFVVKICNVCLKKTKINEKEAEVGPFLKKTISETAKVSPVLTLDLTIPTLTLILLYLS